MIYTISSYNQFWKLGRAQEVELVTLPICLTVDIPCYEIYDELLVLRRHAREQQDWTLADALRDYSDLTWGLTIVDGKEGNPGGCHDFQYFKPVRYIAWYKKWRPYLRATTPDKNLDNRAKQGLGSFAPGSVSIV